MVRVRYTGIYNPQDTFARFKPWRAELVALRLRCFPMKPDYLALAELITTLDRTATHFTGDDDFYKGTAPFHSTPASGIRE